MSWTLILLFSLFGILMGTLSVLGFTKKAEPILWLIVGFFTAYMISRKVSEMIFWHGFIIGIFWGCLSAAIQSIFFKTYLKNNPKYAEAFQKNTKIKSRYLILLVGPLMGLLTGTVLGGLAWFFQKIF
ncbi:MAG TPA: hypothetical protein VG676_10690 [Chitinophagaceae bacterium]|jgi:H+/Cl- antiporter ClcA|nr:hypothetical protein [Chitinophagaceae bacterium]